MHLRTILAKTMALFRRGAIERELEKEQASHLDFIADSFIEKGMSLREAELAAKRAYGNRDQAKQLHRDERSFMILERALRTFQFSMRSLYKNRWLSLAILLTLAVGTGANTTMFTVVYAVLLAPLPSPNPEQLTIVASKVGGHSDYVSAADFLDWKQNVPAFTELNAWSGGGFNLSLDEEPENILAMHVTTGYFHMLGDHFSLGRDFRDAEGELGNDHEVILTHKMWLRLGGDQRIVGTVLRMDGEPYTVVGVLNPGYRDREGPQLIVPLAFKPVQLNHEYHWLTVMGRIAPPYTLPQVQAGLDTVNKRISQQFPNSNNTSGKDSCWIVTHKALARS
jgi:putative ABC transport system permease protein